MNLVDLVTSRELSEKLKSAGVEQDSIYYWHKDASSAYMDGKDHRTIRFPGKQYFSSSQGQREIRQGISISAFIAEEVLAKLPLFTKIERIVWEGNEVYRAWHDIGANGTTAAEAAGNLLLKMLEVKK